MAGTPSGSAAEPGCAFRPRCARATAGCEALPPLAEVDLGRLVRCIHPL
jgi:peptide/nickel transport system ATP-binding protein